MNQLDVAIVGGGLAGNLLARQLVRRRPDLRIGLFERDTATSFKVGEATVEIASNYLTRRLGLSSYLYERQLPKNGLRYFFDTEDRSTPLVEMSEMGTLNLPFHPAFQLDRAALEADLLEMNRRDGVHVRTGTRVGRIRLGAGGELHRFETTDGSGKALHEARWLIDAAGRTGLLARELGLREPDPGHRLGSVWGRFEGVVDIDTHGPEAWRARVRHTARRLSTIHFMYPGYWIWFIPLRGGLTSVGVTGEAMAENRELRTPEGFRAFLDSHRAIGELLAPAKLIDIGSYLRIAYGTRRLFHTDRWALVGEAATSADPLYSPGSDFIALENDLVTDLVARDFAGEPPEAWSERCELFDAFVRFRHEAAILLYRGQYGTLGSFELARAKWDFDIGCYYNLWASAYMRDEHLDLDWLRGQLRLRPLVLRFLETFSELFRGLEAELRAHGQFFRANTGRFHYGLENIDFAEAVGTERPPDVVMATTLAIFNHARAQAHEMLGRAASHRDVAPLPMAAFLTGRALA